MNRIDGRMVRIHAIDDAWAPAQRSRRRTKLDYAALMRRGARQRQPDEGGTAMETPEDDGVLLHDVACDPYGTKDAIDANDTHTNKICSPSISLADQELIRSLPDTTAVVARNIATRTLQEEQHMARLAQTIFEFCGSSTVNAMGCWSLQIAVDPALLRHTTLLLSLSPASLSLRFDVGDAVSKQLVLNHSSSLKTLLEKLMLKSGWPREIDITVW